MKGVAPLSQKLLQSVCRKPVQRSKQGQLQPISEWLLQELPVAIVFNGVSHAVMMATPADLEEFALGFSLTEGILTSAEQLYQTDIVVQPEGVEVRLEISNERMQLLQQKRRTLAGRSGCGLCGTESLQQLQIDLAQIKAPLLLNEREILTATEQLSQNQSLHQQTGASHAAAWCDLNGNVVLLREDLGRHNALDKLIGALRKSEQKEQGFILVSSRLSYEMVQKAVVAQAGALVAVSAATSMAVELAHKSGLPMYGFVREQSYLCYNTV